MTPEERAEVEAALPSEFPVSEANPPEGDPHFFAKIQARDVLDSHFRRLRRSVHIGSELPIYYPDEPMFAPDVSVVLDVEERLRDWWLVAREGKGLDFAMEIHYLGSKRKDLERNVEWFARLGIPEYFIFDCRRLLLSGWRLADPSAREYVPIQSEGGRFPSRVLGLDLVIEAERLRFYFGNAPILETREMVDKLESIVDATQRRLTDSEHQLAAALAEIERLKAAR